MKYIGIDGCKAGWFYIRLDQESYDFGLLNSINELPRIKNPESIVCIDIPIGLREKDTQERQCDKEARKLLKKKGPSVFPAPSRLSLKADNYQTASSLNHRHTGRKLTIQSYSISKKIKEVDDLIQNFKRRQSIRECHPELCFLALNDFRSLEHPKKKKEGREERKNILSKYLTYTSQIIKDASKTYLRKQVALDDIIDALVLAVTASFEHQLISVPQNPEVDNKGLKMEIVYPNTFDEDETMVCLECVAEQYLKAEIEEVDRKTKCSYCGKSIKCLSVKWLAERFHSVFQEHFYLVENIWSFPCDPVDYYIQELLEIENEILADDIREYLSDIYGYLAVKDSGDPDPYASDAHYSAHRIDDFAIYSIWKDFCNEIKYNARYFNLYAEEILSDLFNNLTELVTSDGTSVVRQVKKNKQNFPLYRARLCQKEDDLKNVLKNPTKGLGAPPQQKTSAGRMNPSGISVFYGATDIETCINETRPPVGAHLIIGQFDFLRDVKLLDFTLLQQVVVKGSFFDPQHKKQLEQVLFLESAIAEMTRPIMPSQKEMEYLPTQVISNYLSEKIRPTLDGIIFRSSQSKNKGDNVILFNRSSHVKPNELPSNLKIDISMDMYNGEEFDDSITIFEKIPNSSEDKTSKIKRLKRRNNVFGSIAAMEDYESVEYTLNLDMETIKILLIEGVSYSTQPKNLSRIRTVESITERSSSPTKSNPFE